MTCWTLIFQNQSNFANILQSRLKEKFTLIIFSLFHLNWPRIAFYNPIYKNDFFLSKLFFLHHLYKIYMAFYLLTWTYFNDVNGSRNILMNSQLKRILFMSSDKKKWNKTEKDRNDMKKENNSNESDFKENEIPDLNSLKQKQTSEILTVVAVIMRKKVQKRSSGGVL